MKHANDNRVPKILADIKKRKILVIGDVMLDRYLFGRVERISPEAPVPVFVPEREETRPGGAGNVAQNIKSLGAKSILIGERKSKVIRKTRFIASPYNQQLLRVDEEDIQDQPPALIMSRVKVSIAEADAVIISDYGKGVITRELLDELLPFLNSKNKIIMVDPAVKHFSGYQRVTSLTPNLDEASAGIGLSSKPTGRKEVELLGFEILKKLRSRSLLITQGADGMTLFTPGSAIQIPAASRGVFDVTGAGDTVISAFTLAYCGGFSLAESAYFASLAAGIVVGKTGAATASPAEILSALPKDKQC
ncbi:MAG: PfkB family carbohydrate kinase [Candidatus Ratteibacteria bacterium]